MLVPPSAKATRELTRLAKEFGATLSPAWKPLVGIIGDTFESIRAERRFRFIKSFRHKCKELGFSRPQKDVDPKFLFPLLEQAIMETDDDLQDVWATMLANAADAGNGSEMRTAYIGMLSQMTRFDVKILSALDGVAKVHPEAQYLVTGSLPEVVGTGLPESGGSTGDPIIREDVEISLANLSRLGCLLPLSTYGGLSYRAVTLTKLGKAFVAACSEASHT
jgi:hypothetical protein